MPVTGSIAELGFVNDRLDGEFLIAALGRQTHERLAKPLARADNAGINVVHKEDDSPSDGGGCGGVGADEVGGRDRL